jgi:hypothetical protein
MLLQPKVRITLLQRKKWPQPFFQSSTGPGAIVKSAI